MEKVSIIVPYYIGQDILEFLSSTKSIKVPTEIIVIDNHSELDLTKQIRKKFPKVILLPQKENVGFSKAINIGIRKSTGIYIFIGNDDLILSPESISQMVQRFRKDPDLGLLGGKIFFKENHKKVASSGHNFNFLTGAISDAKVSQKDTYPDWVEGCAMMTTRQVIKRVGLLDEGFSLIYFEDADFSFRVRKAGFKVILDPKIFFYHSQSQTFKKLPTNFKYFQWYKSKIRFVLKHSPFLFKVSSLGLQFPASWKHLPELFRAIKWNLEHLP